MSTKFVKKVTSVLLSATTVVWLSGSALFLPVAHAVSVDDLLAQIQALQAQLATLQNVPTTSACSFTRNLTVGVSGSDVKCLQQYLNGAGYKIAMSGAGSPGMESMYFGLKTKMAVAKWQAANSLSPAVGYFGMLSRGKYSMLVAANPTPTPTPNPTPVAGGLSVALAANQPAQGLFGESFASRPFTTLVFTASASGDVTVNSMLIQRTGQSNDAVFNGVVYLNEDGVRQGSSKTFGADHTLRLSEPFVVKAGQSRTITLAGDSDSDQNAYEGQQVSLSLIGVDAGSASVSANYPLTGAQMIVNSTLAIGSATLARGSYDPGAGQTKEIGTTGYTFTGLRLTAGSNEDLNIKSVKFYQAGSAGTTDLANVKVNLDGVDYPTTVSADGKYYTAVFGNPGVLIQKGFSKELYIKGDIASGSNRTADFDLYRYTDLQLYGTQYGYGVAPTATESGSSSNDGNFYSTEPRYDAFRAFIGSGTIQVAVSNKVPSQNVAVNLLNQPLGAYDVIIKGEAVSVAQMIFRFSRWQGTGNTANTQDITNVTLVDENGKVVAGPVDIDASAATLTFSDTVTFPVGTHTYTLKGKIGTDFATDDTIAASTTPSGWSTVRGVTSGTTITPTPSSPLTANTMTVKAGALRVSTLPTPIAQTVVAGLQKVEFAEFSFDATASGEDVRVNSFLVQSNFGQANSLDDLTLCQLWDGTTALNNGSNIVNPSNSAASGDKQTFTFDTSLVIPKGTTKILSLKCNTVATTTATNASTYNFTWQYAGAASDIVPTGVTSGSTITETALTTVGQAITLSRGGSLSVALDASSPAVRLLNANTTNNILTVLRFTATNEAIDVKQLGLVLGGTASNTPQDLSKVTLWSDDGTKVGELVFTADNATATLSGFVVPKNSDKTLTIKGDVAVIGTSDPARPGHLVRVEYDGANADGSGNATRGVGQSSGSTLYATPLTVTSSNGARIFKAVPSVAKLPLASTKLVNATIPLYRFSVTAPSTGPVGLYKFSYRVATSTSGGTTQIAVTTMQVRGYSDSSFSQSAYSNNGLLNSTTMGVTGADANVYEMYFDPVGQAGTKEAIQVPTGQTRYFELVGTVANTTSTSSITVSLQGDAAYTMGTNNQNNDAADNWVGSSAGNYAFATTAVNVDVKGGAGTEANNFIWSGNSTTTQPVSAYDWANGFSVPGLPSTNLTAEVLTP